MAIQHKALRTQRKYNKWVANETLEDFALRYTAKKARKWSNERVANTALGIVSFLALEAIGGAITLNYGFTNAFYAITVVSIIIFVSGIPICYFSAKSGIDIDLLTRGAGFGYIGSTVSSLIYASFTFIFFALEAAIMSMAINILFGIPLSAAYVISALVVIPLVTHGITRISVFQLWTQPIWLLLQIIPLIVIAMEEQKVLATWTSFSGIDGSAKGFNIIFFGAASAVIFPLIAQNGEQVDFLRFLPKPEKNKGRWWASLIFAGPGWVIVGFVKLLIGSFLAVLALHHGIPGHLADDPSHMYHIAFGYITTNPNVALVLTGVFVIISQLKINVTNAYAGSIAWSNFFSRVTHSHPGRVVWLFFNVSIALLLMELGLYHAFESILITYSALVLAWIGCLVADLTINYWLGLRPREIHFKRSYLYDINPVGVVSMTLASTFGIAAQLGAFTDYIKAISPFIAFLLPFITVPFIAWLTRGKYYVVAPEKKQLQDHHLLENNQAACSICENIFDVEDMSYCPFYTAPICSLCCALDSRCHDQCRPQATLKEQTFATLGYFLPQKALRVLNSPVGHFLTILALFSLLTAIVFSLVYFSKTFPPIDTRVMFGNALVQLYILLMIIFGVLIWLYVLAEKSRKVALRESREQMMLLEQEVLAHKKTEQQLNQALAKADEANLAKTRYLSGVSHELRTPLNTLYGYAQLIERNNSLDDSVRKAAKVISNNGEHITHIIEGLLEISKIEARRADFLLKENVNTINLIEPLVDSFGMQARLKGIDFHYECARELPEYVMTDSKRIRQILMNLLSNAIKFTESGHVTFSIHYRNEVAKFVVEDTGIGISKESLGIIFEPFERASDQKVQNISGTGLGLSISRLLAELLGGDISVKSEPGKGSVFTFSVLLPSATKPALNVSDNMAIASYKQEAIENINILVVDDELEHRSLVNQFLSPLGFNVLEAAGATEAHKIMEEHKIDLFILDVFMPEVDGWTLAQQIKDDGFNAPIIMLSGNAIENQRDEMEDKLHAFYLIKPVSIDVLLDKVCNCLDIETLPRQEKPIVASEARIDPANIQFPPDDIMNNIVDAAAIGHINGVEKIITQLEKDQTEYRDFIRLVKNMVESFNLPAIVSFIEENR